MWTDNPLLSRTVAQGGVADEVANILSDPTIEDAASVIDPRISDFIQYGVFNGVFARGPQDPDANIEDINPLPDWTGPVNVSGAAITTRWVDDASAPSGHSLQFTASRGAAADEAYLEQIVPIGGDLYRAIGNYIRVSFSKTGTFASFTAVIGVQYLDVTGNAVGNATEGSMVLNLGNWWRIWAHAESGESPPATAAYLRIRIGLRRTGAAADECTFSVSSVRNDFARAFVLISELGTPASFSAGEIYQNGGGIVIAPDGESGTRLIVSATTGAYLQGAGFHYDKQVIPTGIIFPTISAGQNDWAPTGWATCSSIYVNCSAAGRTITGLSATGWTEGQIVWISGTNTGGGGLTLAHASASSTSGNRFTCPGGAGYVINDSGGVAVQYVPTVSAANPFRVLGKS